MRKTNVGVMWSTAVAIALGSGVPVATAAVTGDAAKDISPAPLAVQAEFGWENLPNGEVVASATARKVEVATLEPSSGEKGAALPEMAQFQVPRGPRDAGEGPSQREARKTELPAEMKFGYAYGSDSELTYLKNPDLDNRVRDDFIGFAPTLFGFIDYRPNNWLETRVEMTLEVPIVIKEEKIVVLPDGRVQVQQKSKPSLLIDQAYVHFKNIAGPFAFTIGRRNFEDPRLWLYDAALDAFIVTHKAGNIHTEASISQENLVDGDLLVHVPRSRINNFMLYTEYRGIEDHKIAGYVIKRDDRSGREGDPLLMGVRAYGRPTDAFNYWTELGFARGNDELNKKLDGYAYDLGATYRFPHLPLHPSFTLGYAFGSGDNNPNDATNNQFRQTGLQSNEARFGGYTQFKAYGETLDPELSNIKIFTAGIGARLAPTVFLDLVYHNYRLDEIAGEFRSSGLTAQMNQVDTHLSKDVGNELDIILGFRNLFGYRRLGFELRAGWFRPGKAFLRNDGLDEQPIIRKADKGMSILAVIIY